MATEWDAVILLDEADDSWLSARPLISPEMR